MKKDAVIQGKGFDELENVVKTLGYLFDTNEFMFQLRLTNVGDEKVNNLPE